jgi:AAA+ ATPase superfamily predicted ATPase
MIIMQKIKFLDREKELSFLQEMYNKSGGLIIIYGRRRVGKTELIKQFISEKKHLYYLADKRGTPINAKNMAKLAAETFNEVSIVAENFDDVFKFIGKRINEKFIVVIDEFSYLVKKDSAIPSIFQLIIDEIIREKDILLILSGSSISMMYNGTLSYKSPLYGRKLGEWKLNPLNFKDIIKFFPGTSIENSIQFYAIFGNIPAFLIPVDSSKTLKENIINNLLKKGSRLYREPEFLLKEELRDPSRYISIFEALCQSTKLSEIASKSGVPAKDMPKYFEVLSELELVKKEIPVTEKKTKNSHYYINDNLFYFYFRFVHPYISLLEEGREELVYTKMELSLQLRFSNAFENIMRENVENHLSFLSERTGRWWGHSRKNEIRTEEEIDIVTLNSAEMKIAFIECKYTNLTYKDTLQIITDLKRKAGIVNWFDRQGTEFF